MKLAVANLKGGTSKTTSSMFLAAALSRRGRTLLVDCDPQGSALSWAESAEEDAGAGALGFSVMGLPTRDVHRKLQGFEGDYEHIVLDTPPVEIGVTRAALLAADTVLVALSPTSMDLDRVMPTLELIAEVEPLADLRYHVLLARVRRISREARDTREVMVEMELPVLQTEVPLLGYYSDAFGYPLPADLRDYELVAAELLGEPIKTGEEVSA